MRILYHFPLCPFSRKIRLVLSEKRLPFELRLERPWERRTDYLELNPAGTVPTLLEENGLVIPDSWVIGEYLDEAYPDTSLLGRTLAERVEIRRLLAWFDGKFYEEVTRNLVGRNTSSAWPAAASRPPGRCGKAMRICASTWNIWAGWRRRANGWPAAASRWPILPPPRIFRCWISPAISIGTWCPPRATGMRA